MKPNLSQNQKLLAILAVLVRRAGGVVIVTRAEALGVQGQIVDLPPMGADNSQVVMLKSAPLVIRG